MIDLEPKYIVKIGWLEPKRDGSRFVIIQPSAPIESVAEAIDKIKTNLPRGYGWIEEVNEPAHIPNRTVLPSVSNKDLV